MLSINSIYIHYNTHTIKTSLCMCGRGSWLFTRTPFPFGHTAAHWNRFPRLPWSWGRPCDEILICRMCTEVLSATSRARPSMWNIPPSYPLGSSCQLEFGCGHSALTSWIKTMP